jgi:hydroxylaminobenzene mutase
MDRDGRAHGLFLHGMVLVVAGLLMGAVVQAVTNPRMGLSAHTGTLMNGILLIAMGAFWPRIALAVRLETVGYWLLVEGSYLNAASLFLAGAFGTSRSTPLHGAGHAGTELQELLVGAGLVLGAIAVLAGCGLALVGLAARRRRP